MGLLKTAVYCVDKRFAILDEDAVYSLFSFKSGPIDVLVDEYCLAYERNISN